jgi:hypothetical protein
MGGYGSTRWNSHSKKYAVEDGYVLHMKTIHASLVPYWQGTITWSRNGENVACIAYRVITNGDVPNAIQLIYTGNGKDFNYIVDLSTTPLPWGGHRYWFTCPNSNCHRRVASLYLSPGNPFFACRTCHKLTYRSCQEKGQSESFYGPLAGLMQDVYPGITAKDMEALLEDRYTDHMQQILLEKYSHYLANLPDPYEHYLTVEELCQQSGLVRNDFENLSAYRLLLPDHEGKFRPKLVRWAGKLAYLLNEGWETSEIKRWAKGRFQTGNPKEWPPNRTDWQI